MSLKKKKKSMQYFEIYAVTASETSTFLFVQRGSTEQVRRHEGERDLEVSIRTLFAFL